MGSLKVLVSSLACSPAFGSESLVGYRVATALSKRYDTEIITSASMQAPGNAKIRILPVQFDDSNDVGALQLLKFELRQRGAVGRLLRNRSFDAVHRITPSGYKESLLKVPAIPLVVGPVLGADSPPESFQPIFRPALPRRYSLKALTARIGHGVARRVFARFSTLDQLLENAALILVGTEVTRRRLPARLQSRCRFVTYSGVEHDRFTPPAKGRKSAVPQLLFVGRLVPYKGVELLLRAVARARWRCRFELKIVGSGLVPYKTYCHQLAAEFQLMDTIKFVDRVPREALVEMYQSADIFCMPSIETYGIAILEAMSSGCAVIVADFNGPGEIVPPGVGLKVPLDVPEQFIEEYADRIVELVEDMALRRQLGDKAREHVVRFHDWKRIESSWLECYDELFSNKTTAAQSTVFCGTPGSQ